MSREMSLERGGGDRSDRSTGIGRAESATALLRSRLSPMSLGHFGPQLNEAGWQLPGEWTGARSAGQTWRAGFDGLQLVLFFSVVER